MAFLAERTGRSPHTRRAYVAEIRRLIAWCHANRICGPLSDLSRAELIQFGNSLPGTRSQPSSAMGILGARSCTRALAVVQSMYGYLLGTGYMTVNPAAELGQRATDRAGYRPNRFLPRAGERPQIARDTVARRVHAVCQTLSRRARTPASPVVRGIAPAHSGTRRSFVGVQWPLC